MYALATLAQIVFHLGIASASVVLLPLPLDNADTDFVNETTATGLSTVLPVETNRSAVTQSLQRFLFVTYEAFQIPIYKNVSSKGDSVYYYPPLLVASPGSAVCRFNRLRRRYELNFSVLMWDEKYITNLLSGIGNSTGSPVRRGLLQMLPIVFARVQMTGTGFDGLQLVSRWISNSGFPSAVNVRFIATGNDLCYESLDIVRREPEDFFGDLSMVYSYSDKQTSDMIEPLRVLQAGQVRNVVAEELATIRDSNADIAAEIIQLKATVRDLAAVLNAGSTMSNETGSRLSAAVDQCYDQIAHVKVLAEVGDAKLISAVTKLTDQIDLVSNKTEFESIKQTSTAGQLLELRNTVEKSNAVTRTRVEDLQTLADLWNTRINSLINDSNTSNGELRSWITNWIVQLNSSSATNAARIFDLKSSLDRQSTKLDSRLTIEQETETGVIVTFYSSGNIPAGWLECDGSVIDCARYSRLCMTTGMTRTPDFRGRFPRGTRFTVGETGGEAEHVLTQEEMPSHWHSYLRGLGVEDVSLRKGDVWSSVINAFLVAPNNGDVLRSTKETTTSWTGSSRPHNNLPPYLSVRFIIRT